MNQKEFDFRVGCIKSLIKTHAASKKHCLEKFTETDDPFWYDSAVVADSKMLGLKSAVRNLTAPLDPELRKEFES